MRRSSLVLAAALLGACSPPTTPTWAFDPIWLEPDGDGVYGFHTWQVYSEPWADNPDGRYYLCSVVVELVGEPTDCADCQAAWAVTPSVLESDCTNNLQDDPLFTSLVAVGVGEISTERSAPYPGLTDVGWADYGYGWEEHGFAWPEVVAAGGEAADATWDGERAFELWPRSIWPIEGGASTGMTPVSRSGR